MFLLNLATSRMEIAAEVWSWGGPEATQPRKTSRLDVDQQTVESATGHDSGVS
jgi:hypothetical protein